MNSSYRAHRLLFLSFVTLTSFGVSILHGAPPPTQRLLETSASFPERSGWPPKERLSHDYGPIVVPRSGRLTMTVSGSPNVRQEVLNLTREDSSVQKISFGSEEVNLKAEGFPECNAPGSNPAICTSVWDAPAAGDLGVQVLQSGVWNIWGEFSSPPQNYTLTVDFVPGPTVTSISPSEGSAGGHRLVTISGAFFEENAMVLFDGVAATDVVVASSSQLTCVTPPGVGTVEVTVLNPDPDRRPWNYGRPWGLFGKLQEGYTYTASSPLADPLDPEQFMMAVSGFFEEQASVLVDDQSKQQFESFAFTIPGAGRLRFETWAFIPITGPTFGAEGDELNFEAFNDSSAVRSFFGGDGKTLGTTTECTEIGFVDSQVEHYDAVICDSVRIIDVEATGGGEFKMWGPARLSALFNDFRSAPYQYYGAGVYFAHQPMIASIEPANGAPGGGTTVAVRGNHFGTGAKVMFGDQEATGVTVLDRHTIRCTAPPRAVNDPNVVNVAVELLGMTVILESAFTYGPISGDHDMDGLDDLVEIFMGLNPKVFDSKGAFSLTMDGSLLRFTYRRNKTTSIQGTVQWSSDMKTWNTVGLTERIVGDFGAYESVEASLSLNPSQLKGRRYVRLLVQQ